MSQARDGKIVIESKILTGEFEAGAEKIADSAKKTADSIRKTGKKMRAEYDRSALDYIAKGGETAAKSTNKLKRELDGAAKKVKELEEAGKWLADPDYDEAVKELESLKQEAKAYKKELTGGAVDNPFRAGTVSADLFEAQQEFDKLVAEGAGLGEKEYDEAYIKLVKAKEAYTAYKKELTRTEPVAKAAQEQADLVAEIAKTEPVVDEQKESVQELEEELEDYTEQVVKAEKKTGNFSKVASRFGRISRTVANGVGSFASGVGSLVKDGFDKIGSRSKGAEASLAGSVKTIARYVFGIESLFFLMNKIRDFGAEGLANLAKESKTTKASIDALKGGLLTLKNALAAAVGPILNIAGPALASLANMAARAANHVGMLIATLTGQKTFTKAIEAQGDVSSGLDDTAESAENAAKAMNDYLSPLDEINRIGSQDSSSGSTAGGSTSSTGPMFEEVPIENSIASLADNIRSHIDAEDFEGLGTYLAEKLNKGMGKVYDVISWKKVGPKVTKFTNKFTEAFNSFVKKLDTKKMGKVVGAGINTVINTVNGFVRDIKWKQLGQKFGDGINGIFEEVDGEALGEFLSNKFKIAIEFVSGVVENIGWGPIGTKIGKIVNGFFKNLNADEIANIVNNVIKGAIQLLKGLMKETDWKMIWNKIMEIWKGLSTESRVAILGGIFASFIVKGLGAAGNSTTLLAGIGVLAGIISYKLEEKLKTGINTLGKKIAGFITDGVNKKKPAVNVMLTASLTEAFKNTKKAYDRIVNKTAKVDVNVPSGHLKKIQKVATSLSGLNSKTVEVTLRYRSDRTGPSGYIARALGLSTGGIYKNGHWQPIQGYASGGYPTSARLFYANENGMPELVGRIGSNTAVMNNGQIVASVAAGVYQAVATAFGQLQNYFAIMSQGLSKLPEVMERYTTMFPRGVAAPALAMGSYLPPQASYDSKDIKSLTESIEGLKRQIQTLTTAGSGGRTNGNTEYRFTAYVGRKVLFDEVIAEARVQQQATNRNPFDLM